jgi:ATP-dependent DNA ligase
MGLEGIVSKRLGSGYRAGLSPDWLKFKNPEHRRSAVRRRRTGAEGPDDES